MKVDGGLGLSPDIDKIVANAKAQEAAGYDGVWTAETSHDPFLPLVLAAEHTETLELGTSIAVAFVRNPMLLANLGWDLQALSKGRFNLGLGLGIVPGFPQAAFPRGLHLFKAGSRSNPKTSKRIFGFRS